MVFKLQEFGDEYEFRKPNLQDCFQMYHSVREFKIMVEQVDFKISDKMKIEEWFSPMLHDWVELTGKHSSCVPLITQVNKFAEWTKIAIKVDKFELIDSEMGQLHSTSAIDIFTFIRQQLDYLSDLSWPNKDQESSIRIILLESISQTVGDYSHQMILLSKTELIDMKSGKDKMFKIPMTKKKINIKLPKQKTHSNPNALRVSDKSCVRVNNLKFIQKNIGKIISNLNCKNAEQMTTDKTSHPLCITFLELINLSIRKPYTLKVYIRLSSTSTGQELCKTGIFYQKKNLVLNSVMDEFAQTCYLSISPRDMTLGIEVSIMQLLPGKQDFILTRGLLYPEKENGIFEVGFDNGFKIQYALKYQQCDSETMKGLVTYRLTSDINAYILLLGEKVRHSSLCRLIN